MNRYRALLLTGLSCFLLFLLASLPARVVFDFVLPANVIVAGTDGTIWNGQARAVQVDGLRLGRTSWRISAPGLLLATISGHIETALPGGFANGEFSLPLVGDVQFENVEAAGPIAPIASLLNLPAAGGQAALELRQLALGDGWPSALVGTLRLADVPLIVPGLTDINGAYGSFQVAFTDDSVADDAILRGELSDFGGALELAGQIALQPPANYEVTGRVRTRSEAPEALRDGLAMLGPADVEGRRPFSLAGSF